jgi:hypothetical protein
VPVEGEQAILARMTAWRALRAPTALASFASGFSVATEAATTNKHLQDLQDWSAAIEEWYAQHLEETV